MDFDLFNLSLGALIIFVAYMVRGIAGFGSALISVPLLALLYPIPVVVPLVVFLDFVGSASQGMKNRTLIVWREQLPLIPFAVIGIAGGLTLLSSMGSASLAQALGAFVILYAIYQLLPLPDLRGPRILVIPFGLLGGLVGTLFGTGGPFYMIYLTLRGLEKGAARATFAANFLIDGAIRLAAYATVGFFHSEVLLATLAALPVAAAGLWVGGRVHTEISPRGYARMISALLLFSGVALIPKG